MTQQEDEFWSAKILDARNGQLETVRHAAAGWLTLFSAVLGVFGTVSFVSGLPGLDDLAPPTRDVVRAGIAVAVVATLAATVLAGSAANSRPRVTSDLTISAFQTAHKARAKSALRRLRYSMGFGLMAAVVVVSGSLIVLFAEKAPATDQAPKLVAVVEGRTYCGSAVTEDDGTLSLRGVSLDGATLVVSVDACPDD